MKSLRLPFRYLPKDEGIIIMEVSGAKYHQKHIHLHDHNELLFITKEADCMIYSNGIQHKIHAPALILHRGGSYHGTDMLKSRTGYSSFVIFFKSRVFGDLPDTMLYRDRLFCDDCEIFELNATQLERYTEYLKLIRAEKGNTEKLKLLLLILFCETAGITDDTKNIPIRLNADIDYIFSVLQYISEHYEERLSIPELSERFHISATKLNSDFHRVTDLTIKEMCTRLRLGRAVELLTKDKLTVAEIAYQCGFSSESYFIQVFGKYMGTTPKRYMTEAADKARREKDAKNGREAKRNVGGTDSK